MKRWEFSGESPGPPVDYVQGPIYATVLGPGLLGLRDVTIEARFGQHAAGTIALCATISPEHCAAPGHAPHSCVHSSSVPARLASARASNAAHPSSSAACGATYLQCGATCLQRSGLLASEAVDAHHRIIASHHDSITAGHPGRAKTQELVQCSYWWPSIRPNIQAYVKGCAVCQRTKIDHCPRTESCATTSKSHSGVELGIHFC